MKVYLALPLEESSLHIEAEPLSHLVIHLAESTSLQEVQSYAHAHGILWVRESKTTAFLFFPWGTVQQRMEESCTEREEVYLIHLPGGGALEHRRVLHQSIALDHPWAEALRVSTLSLLRPVA